MSTLYFGSVVSVEQRFLGRVGSSFGQGGCAAATGAEASCRIYTGKHAAHNLPQGSGRSTAPAGIDPSMEISIYRVKWFIVLNV
jgi:hypothetical protein